MEVMTGPFVDGRTEKHRIQSLCITAEYCTEKEFSKDLTTGIGIFNGKQPRSTQYL
jgi:hypothetical protein